VNGCLLSEGMGVDVMENVPVYKLTHNVIDIRFSVGMLDHKMLCIRTQRVI
jgi:hypothetical protein